MEKERVLSHLRQQMTVVFQLFYLKVSDALGMLLVWRAVYWVLLVWLAVEEWLMKLIMEE